MNWTAELFISLMASVGCAVGAYAAIRADLAKLHERATNAMEAAARAHDRIDNFRGHRS